MAGSLVSTDADILDKSLLGYIALSITDYTDGAEPLITAGSKIEIAGALYEFTGDEDIDVAAAWGGFGTSILVYCYINPSTVVPYLSIIAPAWDDAKQGYYLAASPTHRCYMQIFKDAASNYDQKTIMIDRAHGSIDVGLNLGVGADADRIIRFASDVITQWDESESEMVMDYTIHELRSYKSQNGGADVQLFQYVSAGAGSSGDFTIKKPCSVWLDSTIGVGVGNAYIELKVNGAYKAVGTGLTPILIAHSTLDSAGALNPGTYRITATAAGTTTLYAVGVYGATAVTAADIVV